MICSAWAAIKGITMGNKRITLITAATLLGLAACLLLINVFDSAQVLEANPLESPVVEPENSAETTADSADLITITFPAIPDQPWYAQEEIFVHPEPPLAGQPTELCAEVVSRHP